MLKKFTVFLIIIAILAAFAGCSANATLFSKTGSEKWAQSFDKTNPPSLTVYAEKGNYAVEPSIYSTPGTIVAVFEAMENVTVGEKVENDDSQAIYTFTFGADDGSKQSFLFREDYSVVINGTAYETQGAEDVFTAAGIIFYEEEPQTEEQPQTTDDTAQTEGEYAVFSSSEMNFSFLYNPAYTAQKLEGGSAVVYTGDTQDVPFFQVMHITGPTASVYLEEIRYSALEEYGDSITEDSGEPADIGIEGRSVYGIQFSYNDSTRGAEISCMAFAEDLSDGSISIYIGSYVKDNAESVTTGMKEAISTFVPDANYYSGNSSDNSTPDSDPAPAAQTSYTLQDYNGGVFTMQLPAGWVIETGGQYAGFSFVAHDPNDPDVQIFYYGEMGPYFKSQAGKDAYMQMTGGVGDAISGLPVLEDPTLTACLMGMPEYESTYNSIMSTPFNFADINNLSNISEQPITTFMSSYAVSESMIMADLTSTTGAPCVGVFQGSIIDAGGYEVNGVDTAPSRGAVNVFGIIAPKDKFESVYSILTQSLSTFRFTEEYIQEGINATNLIGQNAMEVSRQNMAMMDAITENFLDYINDRVRVYIID